MTIETYIKKLQKLAKKYPNSEVVFVGDPMEREGYGLVENDPSKGYYNWFDGEYSEKEPDKEDMEDGDWSTVICVN